MAKIYVINPSSRSDTGITDELAASLSWIAGPSLPLIDCVTLADGPRGIVTERDSAAAAPAVCRFIEAEAGKQEVEGFVVACFSDPGVQSARAFASKPVAGIGEAGFACALALGDLIGTIAVSAGTGGASRRQARGMGVSVRLAGHRGIGLDYGQVRDMSVMLPALKAAGRSLIEEEGAGVLLFAGAGLARYVGPLQDELGVPVIDPVQAAAGVVVAQVMQVLQSRR